MASADRDDPLAEAILDTALPPASRILVAVSGGPDSVALLDTLARLAGKDGRNWALRIGHVNHQLRGEESEADERFVRRFAAGMNIPLDVKRVDVRGFASANRVSIETAARETRYMALHDMRAAWPGDLIATGHTADDQAETVIMHLMRGTGTSGLGGISQNQGVLVRPFLKVRHAQVVEALQMRGLGYRLDSSNTDLAHFRNVVRRTILPVLERTAPGVVPRIARTAHIVRDDASYLAEDVEATLHVLGIQRGHETVRSSSALYGRLHPSLRRGVLRALFSSIVDARTEIGALAVESADRVIRGAGSEKVAPMELPGKVHVSATRDRFSLAKGRPTPLPALQTVSFGVPGRGETASGTLDAQCMENDGSQLTQRLMEVAGPFHALCDWDALGGPLTARSRLPGDRFFPPGMAGSRKLQDLFVNERVPESERDQLVVVASGERIVWIPGFVVDKRVVAHARTARLVHLAFRPSSTLYRDRIRKSI